MAGGLHSVEVYKRDDGKHAWRVKSGGDITAVDGNQGYENEEDCLAGFFGNFFGEWDESFLEQYQKWQTYKSAQYTLTPESQEGVPVRVREADADPRLISDPVPGVAYELDESDPVSADIAGNPTGEDDSD